MVFKSFRVSRWYLISKKELNKSEKLTKSSRSESINPTLKHSKRKRLTQEAITTNQRRVSHQRKKLRKSRRKTSMLIGRRSVRREPRKR
jgi:hypothetical protein